MVSAGIVGIGKYLPSRIVTNFDMAKMVDTSDEWIKKKLGISKRRFAKDTQALSDMGIVAARRAMRDAGVAAEDIDLIIVGALSHDYVGGTLTSNIIKDNIGAKNAFGIDLNIICAGFIYCVEVARRFVESGACKTVLVINGEIFSKYPQSRVTSVIFGDGAGALIMRPVKKGWGILSSHIDSSAEGGGDLGILIGGSRSPLTVDALKEGRFVVQMNGRSIYNFVLKAFPDAVNTVLRKAKLQIKDIDFLIAHQANVNLIRECMGILGLPMSKTYTNIHKYGNIGGGSVTVALEEAVKKGLVKRGDLVVTVAYGAGLAWGANVMRWCGKPDVIK